MTIGLLSEVRQRDIRVAAMSAGARGDSGACWGWGESRHDRHPWATADPETLAAAPASGIRAGQWAEGADYGVVGKRDDMIVHEADPYNAEPSRGALAPRMLTPIDSFYGRNHGPIPLIDPQAWRLRVGGLVARDLELSLDDLRGQFAPRTLTVTLQCAGNRRSGLIKVRDIPGEDPWGPGATSTAEWTGVSLAEVLRAARPRGEAAHVASTRRMSPRSLNHPSLMAARFPARRRWPERFSLPGR